MKDTHSDNSPHDEHKHSSAHSSNSHPEKPKHSNGYSHSTAHKPHAHAEASKHSNGQKHSSAHTPHPTAETTKHSNGHSHTSVHTTHSHPEKTTKHSNGHSHSTKHNPHSHTETSKHPDGHSHPSPHPHSHTRTTKKKGNFKLIIAACGVLLLMIVSIVAIHLIKSHKLKKEAIAARKKELKQGPEVKTAIAAYSPKIKEIVLIGEADPYRTATLYSKISGYLEKIYVDKGDTVVEGQLLAYVNNPEIDQEYNSAVADYENKKKIAERDQLLLKKQFIAQEEADISQTNANMAAANVKSLAEQLQYKYLKAPFSGVITARYVDPGALIQNAQNSQTSAQPVVSMSELERLRIYVYIEQHDAAFLKIGDSVEITLTEKPRVHIKANITRLADQLDQHTKMMLGEVDFENKNNMIVPGSYVQVHIKYAVEQNGREITVPSVALIIHNDSIMVAIVDKDSTLHFKKVKISNNSGEKASLSEGVNVGERVALSVGESFKEGQKIRIAKDSNKSGKSSDSGKSNESDKNKNESQ